MRAKDPHYIKPKADGYYWLYDHRLGSIYPVYHQDDHWHDICYATMENREVIAGPISFPTEADILGQPSHLEAVRQEMWAEEGEDPLWDGFVPGHYWVQFCDQELPELAQYFEGAWGGMIMDPQAWVIMPGDDPPCVLFGPVIAPSKDSGKRMPPSAFRN